MTARFLFQSKTSPHTLSVKHQSLSSVTDHFSQSSLRSDVLVPLLAGGHEVLMRFLSEVSDLGDPFSHPSVGQVTGEAGGVHLELTWSHVSLRLRPQPPRQDTMSVRRQ